MSEIPEIENEKIKANCAFDEMVDIDVLRPNPKNPNKHPDKQIEVLAKIIEHQGWRAPITVSNRSGFVVRGHGRLMAARVLGLTSVPVDFQDYENEADELADLVADNKIAELANVDDHLLKELLKEIRDFDFDFNLTGFEDDEILKLLGTEEGGGKHEDEVPDPPPEPKTEIGDIYCLGNHRLLCGDVENASSLKKLMEKNKAEMILMDPPYNVNYSGCGKHTGMKIKGDNLKPADFRMFLDNLLGACNLSSVENVAMYLFHGSSNQKTFEDSLNQSGFIVVNQIIWVKALATMGWGHYRYKHEPIFYCKKKGGHLRFFGDRKQYTTWEEELTDADLLWMAKLMLEECEQDETTVWRFNRAVQYNHPTQKPVRLCEKAILNSCRRGEIVADFCIGSGTTMIAAEKTGRVCYGMEIDPIFCDVAVRRWEEYTGNRARLIREK